MNRKISFFLFVTLICFLICQGGGAWFSWFLIGNKTMVFPVLFVKLIIPLWYVKTFGLNLNNKKALVAVSLLVLASIMYSRSINVISIFMDYISFFPLYVLLCDNLNKVKILKYCSIFLALVLVPGIVLHFIINRTGGWLTLPIEYPNGDEAYYFWNYFFLLRGASFYETEGIRFQSVFLEPGYLGSLMSFMLYANKFNFRKIPNIILLSSLLLSLSLAGYITAFFMYCYYRYINGHKTKNLVYIAISIFFVYCCAKLYNGGDNKINELIFGRLEVDDDKGIAGNNRVSTYTDYYLKKVFLDGDYMFGIGKEEVDRINGGDSSMEGAIAGAGYKIYIISYGIIPMLIMLLFYFIIGPVMFPFDKKYSLGFVALVILTFIQASYPWSPAWFIPVVLGCGTLKAEEA